MIMDCAMSMMVVFMMLSAVAMASVMVMSTADAVRLALPSVFAVIIVPVLWA